MIALLIPVKDFHKAKSRLSTLLSAAERADLARVMFEDVTESLCQSSAVLSGKGVQVTVLSNSQQALEHAKTIGWNILSEENQSSESESVDWASRLLAGRGFGGVMRLPADIPLITAEDVDRLLGMTACGVPVLMVPSHDGTGTNALFRCPPDIFPSRFGPGSLALHQEEARAAGAEVRIVDIPRIAMDVDEPADLVRILSYSRDNRTLRLLKDLGIHGKLRDIEIR